MFRDGGPNGPTINAEVELRSQRSRILKSFHSDFIAYALESESKTFKKAMCTPEYKCENKL